MADHEMRFVGSGLRMPERLIRMSIAALVPLFGVIAVVALFSNEGPRTTAGRAVVIVVALTTVPAAIVDGETRLQVVETS